MLRLIFIVFVVSNILFMNCSDKNKKFTSRNSGLEYHRQLALEEKRIDFPWLDSLYYSVNYEIPDTISQSDPRMKYVKEHPNLPKYIIRAIFKKQTAYLMTINEWLLSHPDELRELKAGTIIMISTPQESNIVYVGYVRYFNREYGMFLAGGFWIFKYGFYWTGGTI